MALAETRARTTQNRVLSEIKRSASLTICALTTTCEASSPMRISSTNPISTSLNLILVFPASSPSADLKVTVICGPFSVKAFTTSQPPMSAATTGTTHTSEKRRLRLLTDAAGSSGKSDSEECCSLMHLLLCIPD